MLWRLWSTNKKDKELEEAKTRIQQLERDYHSLALTLQNLQSAIVAISRNADVIANDVRQTQEMVHSFLHEVDTSQLMFGLTGQTRDDN
jgi:chromosome segregation ATPase